MWPWASGLARGGGPRSMSRFRPSVWTRTVRWCACSASREAGREAGGLARAARAQTASTSGCGSGVFPRFPLGRVRVRAAVRGAAGAWAVGGVRGFAADTGDSSRGEPVGGAKGVAPSPSQLIGQTQEKSVRQKLKEVRAMMEERARTAGKEASKAFSLEQKLKRKAERAAALARAARKRAKGAQVKTGAEGAQVLVAGKEGQEPVVAVKSAPKVISWVQDDRLIRSDRFEAKVFYDVAFPSPKNLQPKKEKEVQKKEKRAPSGKAPSAKAPSAKAADVLAKKAKMKKEQKEARELRAALAFKQKQREDEESRQAAVQKAIAREMVQLKKMEEQIKLEDKRKWMARVEAGDPVAIARANKFRKSKRPIKGPGRAGRRPPKARRRPSVAERSVIGPRIVGATPNGYELVPKEEMARRWAKIDALEARGWRDHDTLRNMLATIPAKGTTGSAKFRERNKKPLPFSPDEPPFVELRVWVEGWSLQEVQEKASWIESVSKEFNLPPKSKTALPKQVSRGTVLRSPFIYSKHRDAYQTVLHRRLYIFDSRNDARHALLGKNAGLQADVLNFIIKRKQGVPFTKDDWHNSSKQLARTVRGKLDDGVAANEARLRLAHDSRGMYGGGINQHAMLERAKRLAERPEGSKHRQPYAFVGEMLGREVLRFSEVLKAGAYDMKLKIKSRGIV